MSESRFERWSRLKAEARVEEQVEQQEVEGDGRASEEVDELAVNEILSDDEGDSRGSATSCAAFFVAF